MTAGSKTGRFATAAGLLLGLAGAAPPAGAGSQLFKCVIDKRIVYQQQACPANAESLLAPASAASAGAAPKAAPPAPPSHPVRPASPPASAARARPR